MAHIVVTTKGERLLSTNWGIPYGLVLAYVDHYWYIGAIAVFVIMAIMPFLGGCAIALPIMALIFWADTHFKP